MSESLIERQWIRKFTKSLIPESGVETNNSGEKHVRLIASRLPIYPNISNTLSLFWSPQNKSYNYWPSVDLKYGPGKFVKTIVNKNASSKVKGNSVLINLLSRLISLLFDHVHAVKSFRSKSCSNYDTMIENFVKIF